MNGMSRRDFVAQFGLALAGTTLLSRIVPALADEVFDIVVAGDSIILGQGLRQKDKFYSIISEWIATEVFHGTRELRLTVKAHSGARIRFADKQLDEMRRVGQPTDRFYYPEASTSFPSITTQVEIAHRESPDPRTVKLVMLSGGITDLVSVNAVNPFFKKSKFLRLVHLYCNEEMGKLLAQVTKLFPEANVAVFGYFPIVSTKSDTNKIAKTLMKMIRFPHQLQWLLTNGFSKQFMKILRKAACERSRLWLSESNKGLSEAIARTNAAAGEKRVVFVPSPVTEETCFATPNSLLWSLDEDNLPEDDTYEERVRECPRAIEEVRYKPLGPTSLRICEVASIAHPNKSGSIAYAEAAKRILLPMMMERYFLRP